MKNLFIAMMAVLLFPIHLSAQLVTIDNGPLCGDNNYSLNGSKWNKTNLKYYIYNTSAHLTPTARETAINNAFDQWERFSRHIMSMRQI